MKRELTRQQGIALFILFTVGLVLITIFALLSSNSGASGDQGSSSSSSSSSSTSNSPSKPKATPTPAPVQEDRSSSDSVRRDLILTTAGFMTGVDPAVPLSAKLDTLGGHLSTEAKDQLTKQMSQYDWNKITTQQYLRLPDVVRVDTISQTSKEIVMEAHVNLIESTGGSAPTELPSEVWQFTLKDVAGQWQITTMKQVS